VQIAITAHDIDGPASGQGRTIRIDGSFRLDLWKLPEGRPLQGKSHSALHLYTVPIAHPVCCFQERRRGSVIPQVSGPRRLTAVDPNAWPFRQ
jgi:hypothetical protein